MFGIQTLVHWLRRGKRQPRHSPNLPGWWIASSASISACSWDTKRSLVADLFLRVFRLLHFLSFPSPIPNWRELIACVSLSKPFQKETVLDFSRFRLVSLFSLWFSFFCISFTHHNRGNSLVVLVVLLFGMSLTPTGYGFHD